MITKTASRIISTRFEKQANFILGHALQNLYGRASLRFPKLFGTEKMFLRNMVKPEQGMSTMRGNAAFGLAKGVVPEVGIMNEQFGRLGKNLGENLAQKGISLSELDNRDIVVLRRLLRGDFVKALESNSPRANELVTAMIGALRPELKPLVESGIITPGVLRKQLKKSIRSCISRAPVSRKK